MVKFEREARTIAATINASVIVADQSCGLYALPLSTRRPLIFLRTEGNGPFEFNSGLLSCPVRCGAFRRRLCGRSGPRYRPDLYRIGADTNPDAEFCGLLAEQ